MTHDSDRGPERRNFTNSQDEERVLQFMGEVLASWSVAIELIRTAVNDWADRRKGHLQAARKTLSDAEQLPPGDKAAAASKVFRQELGNMLQDLEIAAFQAMTYSGSVVRQVQEGMLKSYYDMPSGPRNRDSNRFGADTGHENREPHHGTGGTQDTSQGRGEGSGATRRRSRQ
jgi:hypothetical protein